MERQLTDRIETYDNEIVGHCVCNKVVYKVINTNLEMRKDKTRYRYPEDNRPVDIFRCSNCLQVISESWRAGVVENFEHVLTKEPQTEALNKHNVGGRSEQLAAFLRWYWKEVDGKPYEISAEEVVKQFGG